LRSAIATRDALVAKQFGPEYQPLVRAKLDVTNAQAALVAARSNVIESVKNDYNAAVQEERSMSAQVEEAKNSQMDINRKGVDYGKLQRQADSTRAALNTLITQQKELSVIANSKENN